MQQEPSESIVDVQRLVLEDAAHLRSLYQAARDEAELLSSRYNLKLSGDDDYIYDVVSALECLRINPFTNEVV